MSERAQAELLTLVVDLAANAPSQDEMSASVEPLSGRGIRFFTLESAGDSPEIRLRLYQLVREGVVDDPSADGTFMDFEAFSAELFENYYWRWAGSQFLAAAAQEWVGLTNLQFWEEGTAQFGVTVVKRAYRRQGIGRTLKLLALSHARSRGVRSITTRNDPRNLQILELNQALGFRINSPSEAPR